MAERFVRHLSEVVSVGDNVTVWVTGIDKTRGKISLSIVKGKYASGAGRLAPNRVKSLQAHRALFVPRSAHIEAMGI